MKQKCLSLKREYSLLFKEIVVALNIYAIWYAHNLIVCFIRSWLESEKSPSQTPAEEGNATCADQTALKWKKDLYSGKLGNGS